MNRLRQALNQRAPFGRDPFDDPLNQSWDAVVSHTTAASPAAVPDEIAFLRHVHALETAALPSPDFLGNLEQQLRGTYPAPVSTPERESHGENQRIVSVPPAPKRKIVMPRTHRMTFMPAALVAAVLILVTTLGVFYLAVPRTSEPLAIPAARAPEPALQTLVQFDFVPPMLGLPDHATWEHMDFSLLQLDPGKTFTTDTDWYTAVDAPLIFTVVSGELTMRPAGPALFYAAGQAGQPPVEIAAGQTVSLGPEDTLVYSSLDTATGSNLGSEPVLTLLGSAGQLLFDPQTSPLDITIVDFNYADDMPVPPAQGASITLQRLRLEPFDTFVFDPGDTARYLVVFDQFQMDGMRIARGEFDALTPDVDSSRLHSSTQLTHKNPGPHTIFHLGEAPTNIYVLTLEFLPEAGTPAA